MKCLVFDTGSVISLAMNNLLWVLEELKNRFNGEFYIPYSVQKELIDVPMKGKRFKLEAIMVLGLIKKGVLKVYDDVDVNELDSLVNNLFFVKGKSVRILQKGEVSALGLVLNLNANAYVVDERTMRMLIEDVIGLKGLLERKLQSKVNVDEKKVKILKTKLKNVNVIRSTELMIIGYEKGLFKNYVDLVGNKEFLDGLLWGLRLRGAAISTNEINKLIRICK